MEKQHPFRLHDADSLIILKGQLAEDDISFALDTARKNMEICSYDYFNNHIFPDFDGVIGLDFLSDNNNMY